MQMFLEFLHTVKGLLFTERVYSYFNNNTVSKTCTFPQMVLALGLSSDHA